MSRTRRPRLFAATLWLLACAGGSSSEKQYLTPLEDSGAAGLGEPIPGGELMLVGQLAEWPGGAPLASPLCVSVHDAAEPSGGVAVGPIDATVADLDGTFRLGPLNPGSSVGLVLKVEVCAGDLAFVPTLTPVSLEPLTRLPAGAEAPALTAWAIPASAASEWVLGLADAGYAPDLLNEGGLIGHLRSGSGEPLDSAWVPVPEGAVPWYDHGDAGWEAFTHTTVEGDGLYLVPTAPFGTYLARASGLDFLPFLGGGWAGAFEVVDWTSL